MKNCGNNNVIKLQDNSTAKLTKDCEIIPTACAETEGFKTAMLHYEIFKNNLYESLNIFLICFFN